MEVTSSLGGIPSLTAAVVVSVGIFGGIVGFGVMRWSRVHSPIAQGLSMGTAAHAVGSSRALASATVMVLLPVSDSRSTASSQPSSLRRFCISSDISKGWKVEGTKRLYQLIQSFFVRMKGLEPPRLTSLDPKSSAATNTPHAQIGYKSNDNFSFWQDFQSNYFKLT